MKNLLFTLFLLVCSISSKAQITITNADMPGGGDTIRFSQAAITTPIDLTLTGPNYTWDFSTLQSASQDVDSFLSVTSTPFVYIIVFGLNSNVASRGLDLSGFPAVPVSDVYSFFNKSSNNFKQTGYGATISGITTPISFINDDIIYDFPVNYGNIDSSDSNYSLIIPNLASAIGSQRRVNNVDGWGSLITPYGTFNTLRLVSTLTGEDSIYLDTLGFGFSTPRQLTREYKWLANGQKIPVLQINTTELLGVESITNIKYRDSLRVAVGLNDNTPTVENIYLSPNPSTSDQVNAVFELKKASSLNIEIFTAEGRLIDSQSLMLNAGKQNVTVANAGLNLSSGIYLVKFNCESYSTTLRLVVQP